ncbi:MAG: phosphatidate cytidylyltransferase [Erysipelotrichaceae bacterium]|nr:phosphatidate cytidylyltransferase [Erysipelotrichaceae bacterium]MBQ4252902.1 phosphatidate cytidylyltransferase [Erysipelotrichaceae bacterium]
MKQRIITAAIMIAIIFPILYFGGIAFKILAALACIGASWEIMKLFKESWSENFKLICYVMTLALTFSSSFGLNYYIICAVVMLIVLFGWLVFDEKINLEQIGLYYMISNIIALMLTGIMRMYDYTSACLFMVVLGVVMTDSGAYFSGRALGKHKLNPRISPNKTIEGAIGGYLAGAITTIVFGLLLVKGLPANYIITLGLTMPLVSQIGDLAFSAIKRHYDVKDYSNLFPGHGGILDRIDSVSFSCMWAYALMVVML